MVHACESTCSALPPYRGVRVNGVGVPVGAAVPPGGVGWLGVGAAMGSSGGLGVAVGGVVG